VVDIAQSVSFAQIVSENIFITSLLIAVYEPTKVNGYSCPLANRQISLNGFKSGP
jgi:hypothetical protein